jgi:hypothetical protein
MFYPLHSDMQGIYFQIYPIRINKKCQTEVKKTLASIQTSSENVQCVCESVTREKADESRKDALGDNNNRVLW